MMVGVKGVMLWLALLCVATAVVDRTYYIYLGLDISASQQQIKDAFEEKKLKIEGLEDEQAKQKKLKLLTEAYEVLGNEAKRAYYDKYNKDLFKKDIVMANAKKITQQDHRKGKTMKITLPVSVEDVYHGKTVQAQYLKKAACDKCRGTGGQNGSGGRPCTSCRGEGFRIQPMMNAYGQQFTGEATCQQCQGTGKIMAKTCSQCHGQKVLPTIQTVSIQIPHGLPDGNVIKIKNFGDEPAIGAPADLEVTVIQIPTAKWSRNNNDLIYTMEISLKDAIFGFEKSFKHLDGSDVVVSRSEVTHKDTKVPFNNLGIKNPSKGSAGRLIVKFKILLPEWTDRQLDMWEDFFMSNKL